MQIENITPTTRQNLPKILAITGPTAVGKTRLSLAIAKRFDAEIVGMDSVQIYKELDIGSAKPTKEQTTQVPHHLIDLIPPDAPHNVATYRARAMEVIATLHDQGKRVMLVGGTGMYMRMLVHGLVDAPKASDEIRARHEAQRLKEGSSNNLHKALALVDPELAQRLHPNDFIRISRGLEVWELAGKKFSQLQKEHQFRQPNFNALKLALTRPRKALYARVNDRVDQMMAQGFLAECQHLFSTYDANLPSLGTLGYKQMRSHLVDGVPLEEALQEMKKCTRRYAKQQLNWLRSEPDVYWANAPLLEEKERLPKALEEDLEVFFETGVLPSEPAWAGADSYEQ